MYSISCHQIATIWAYEQVHDAKYEAKFITAAKFDEYFWLR